MKTKKKLVKGIMYLNEKDLNESIENVAEELSCLVDDLKDVEESDFGGCPNRDEAIINTTLYRLIDPYNENGYHNYIIPESLIDDRLAKHLSSIDIGPDIMDRYQEKREEIYKNNEEEETEIEIERINNNGVILESHKFYNNVDAANFVYDLYNNNKINETEAKGMLKNIIDGTEIKLEQKCC